MTDPNLSNRTNSTDRSPQNKLVILKMRLHIVEALLIACKNKKIVKGIVESKGPKDKLINTFGLSKEQAQSIVDLKVPIDQIEQSKVAFEIERLKKEIRVIEDKSVGP